MIAEFLTELDLRHVTVVCNDPLALRRPVQAAGSRRPVQELDPSAAPQPQGPPRPHQVPPQSPGARAAARVGRSAAHLRRPGPHHLGTTRQAHAPHPRRTTGRTLPEHPAGVDRRQPNPHPHRPARGPDRPPPHLPRRALILKNRNEIRRDAQDRRFNHLADPSARGRRAATARRNRINLSALCCPEYLIWAPNVLLPRVLYGGCSLGIRHKRRWQRDRSESS